MLLMFPGLLCNVWRQIHNTNSSAAGPLQELPYRRAHTDATGQCLVGESTGLWQKSVYKNMGMLDMDRNACSVRDML